MKCSLIKGKDEKEQLFFFPASFARQGCPGRIVSAHPHPTAAGRVRDDDPKDESIPQRIPDGMILDRSSCARKARDRSLEKYSNV